MRSEVAKKQKLRQIDWITVLLVLALVIFGLVSLANIMATPFVGDEASLSDYLNKLNMEYVQRQLMNFLVGFADMLVILVVDYSFFRSFIKYVYFVNVALLVMLLLIGNSTRGIFGFFNIGTRMFQPSEICKITLIVMISKMASEAIERDGSLKRFKDIALIVGCTLLPALLVFIQPDAGTAFVYVVILLCIVFIAKISWKYILSAFLLVGAAIPIAYFWVMSADQRERIDMFLFPDQADRLGNISNVLRSQESIGSGGLSGKGYFTQGTLAQLKYVPERHTDFIFAGIAEGVGFIGGTILIVLFFVLIFRWLWVASRAKDPMGMCLVIGAMAMLLAHVFENIAMTMGLMPVTGIPLPFISYGGSNLLTNMMGVGLVLNVWMRRHAQRR